MTPREVRRWGVRAFSFSGPVVVVTMVAWAVQLVPMDRPNLVLMWYLLHLTVAACGALAAVAASCHMSVARAFSAGLNARLPGDLQPAPADPRPSLRLVE